ncbi:phosphoglycerate mutase family protein [Kineococcus glutinatus]|uniref:Broad specificity phosphatase PhoE n=1 Tax=Kineococcus glutinatus TaxID=1070872 RepID=A0ABP9HFS7_9ACTN
MFVLVRHAHAGDRRNWPYSDRDRPLSRRGWRQSFTLSARLGDVPVHRLVSSPYRRCLQTLEPLGERVELPVLRNPLLAPDGDPAALEDLLRQPAAEGAVLCTHGELLLGLLQRWDRDGAVRLPEERLALLRAGDRGATEKGAAWLVDERDGLRSATYLPAAEGELVTAR